MRYLYVDNFRGFSDAAIPIATVNFLVGENSTGKTSILGLVDLIANPNFWFNQAFDNEEVKFGHFKDIVSIHSENRSYFTLGHIEDFPSENDKGAAHSRAFLMTFREEQGLPFLIRYTYNTKNRMFSLKRTRNGLFFKTAKIQSTRPADIFYKEEFRAWVREHHNPRPGYRTLPLPSSISRDDPTPLPILISLMTQAAEAKPEKKEADTFQFSMPTFSMQPVVWLAPIRTTPKRTYDEVKLNFSPEGTHTPYTIRKILGSAAEARKFKQRIEKIGKASKLFQSVQIRQFGRGATAPFELDIIIDDKALNISTVGYGVSQSLPVIVELLVRKSGAWFAIQQPEVHLHPKAQAALGDLIFELAMQENKHFLIETHSDFTIDRFRVNYRTKQRNKPDAQVLFFERRAKCNCVTPISIDLAGNLSPNQPASYRDFFVKEEMKLLGL